MKQKFALPYLGPVLAGCGEDHNGGLKVCAVRCTPQARTLLASSERACRLKKAQALTTLWAYRCPGERENLIASETEKYPGSAVSATRSAM